MPRFVSGNRRMLPTAALMISAPESTPAEETEDQLVHTARQAISDANWVVGECSAKWTARYARGRTDADFGLLVGLSADQVYQRRRVWEVFGQRRGQFTGLSWSHFYAALTWNDADDCLNWAMATEASVAEMKAWHRLRQPAGSDARPADPQAIQLADAPLEAVLPTEPGAEDALIDPVHAPFEPAEAAVSAASPSAARQTGEAEYYPYRAGAGSPPPADSPAEPAPPPPSLPERAERLAAALERCARTLDEAFVSGFSGLPAATRQRLLRAARDLMARLESLQ